MRMIIGCMVILAGLPAVAQQKISPDHTLVSKVRKSIVSRTNDFRKQHDLSAVEINEDLAAAAQEFADFMARTSKYGHHADDRTPAQRAKAAGYDYCIVRENIAYRSGPQPSARELSDVFVEGWIDSPGHRENMLAEYVTQTGVAVASNGGKVFYAVQLFGRPKSAAFKVQLLNESSAAHSIVVETDDGSSDEFEIAPGMALRMTRCTPVTISVSGTRARAQVRESQQLVIAGGSDGEVSLEVRSQ